MTEPSNDDVLHKIALAAGSYGRDLLSDMPSNDRFVRPELERIMKMAEEAALGNDKAKPVAAALSDLEGHWAIGSIDMEQVGDALKAVAASIEPLYEHRISYHGLATAESDDRWRTMVEMPGEMVRPNDPSHGLGPGRRVVSAVHVSSEDVNGVRHDNASYEFEGVAGRHAARAFQPEKGISNAYGVLIVEQDRLFLVPMSPVLDQAEAIGPAREVVGFEGRAHNYLHPDGFDGLKTETAASPMSGEFNFHPSEFGAKEGPITFVGVPWTSGLQESEEKLARDKVGELIASEAEERSYQASTALRSELVARGAQYLAAHPEAFADGVDVAAEARKQAVYVLRGREADPEARMIAAEIATDREDAPGVLSSRKLADSLAPESQPKGALRSQAASLTGAMARSEPKGRDASDLSAPPPVRSAAER